MTRQANGKAPQSRPPPQSGKLTDEKKVLDNGKIVEDGTYDELIARNGCFAELVERQRIGDDTNKCLKFGEKP